MSAVRYVVRYEQLSPTVPLKFLTSALFTIVNSVLMDGELGFGVVDAIDVLAIDCWEVYSNLGLERGKEEREGRREMTEW